MPLIKVHLSSCRSPLLDFPRAVDATAFPILGNNGNKPLAKRLNSPPTPYPLCIIVPEYTGIFHFRSASTPRTGHTLEKIL